MSTMYILNSNMGAVKACKVETTNLAYLAYMTCGNPFLPATCNLPSNVLCIVTHFVGCDPPVVIEVINASNSS